MKRRWTIGLPVLLTGTAVLLELPFSAYAADQPQIALLSPITG